KRLNAIGVEALYFLPRLDGLERDYLDRLLPYLAALQKAVSQFRDIMHALSRKIAGEQRYGWFAYRRDLKKYRHWVNQYATEGKDLNAKWRRLRNLPPQASRAAQRGTRSI